MESSAELKERFDQYVVKDGDLEKRVNILMHSCREIVTLEMKKDEDFGELFQEYHFSGSYYDKLAVGDIRHEFDLNVVFGVPEGSYQIRRPSCNDDSSECNFMEFVVTDSQDDTINLIAEQGRISAGKMKEVLKTALDRALTRLKNRVVSESGEGVRVTRTEGLALTLKLQPDSGFLSSIEVDLVPVLRFSLTKLPGELQQRVANIQARVGSEEELCLGVALPLVQENKLEVDFPQIARKVLAGRVLAGPSVRMAVRLLKQERDRVGGPFKKVKSFMIKTVALHAVLSHPEVEFWAEKHLKDRYREIRNSLQTCLLSDMLPDVFFPTINLMARIKSAEVKRDVGEYLEKTSTPSGNQPVRLKLDQVKRTVTRLYQVLRSKSSFPITRCHWEISPFGVNLAVFVDAFDHEKFLEDWQDIILINTDAQEAGMKSPFGLGFVFEQMFILLLPIAKPLASPKDLLVGSRAYEGQKTSVEARMSISAEAREMLLYMAEVYSGAVMKAEAENPAISSEDVKNMMTGVVDKMTDVNHTWTPMPGKRHEDKEITLNISMSGGTRQGQGMSISFNLT